MRCNSDAAAILTMADFFEPEQVCFTLDCRFPHQLHAYPASAFDFHARSFGGLLDFEVRTAPRATTGAGLARMRMSGIVSCFVFLVVHGKRGLRVRELIGYRCLPFFK